MSGGISSSDTVNLQFTNNLYLAGLGLALYTTSELQGIETKFRIIPCTGTQLFYSSSLDEQYPVAIQALSTNTYFAYENPGTATYGLTATSDKPPCVVMDYRIFRILPASGNNAKTGDAVKSGQKIQIQDTAIGDILSYAVNNGFGQPYPLILACNNQNSAVCSSYSDVDTELIITINNSIDLQSAPVKSYDKKDSQHYRPSQKQNRGEHSRSSYYGKHK